MARECLACEEAFELDFSELDFDRWHSCSCLRGSQLSVFAAEREQLWECGWKEAEGGTLGRCLTEDLEFS